MASNMDEKAAASLERPRSSYSLPPRYEAVDNEHDGFACLRSSATTSAESLPEYEPAPHVASGPAFLATGLEATHVFQIETAGHPLFALPLPPKPDPICVYSVLPTGEIGPEVYRSLRERRHSGTCTLVRAGDGDLDAPVCSTMYRIGCCRPPKMRLLSAVARDQEIQMRSMGIHTRAQVINSHLGTLQWRYASRAERKAVGASSLLVLDLVTTIASAGQSKSSERRRTVAQLVRNKELRSGGTNATTAGNGGRLLVDLRCWADTKAEVQQAEVLVIASCISMLKKEVDRRRMHQIMAMSGAAGGC